MTRARQIMPIPVMAPSQGDGPTGVRCDVLRQTETPAPTMGADHQRNEGTQPPPFLSISNLFY